MKAKKKRKNPADLTPRNNNARKKEIDKLKSDVAKLLARVRKLEIKFALSLAG